MKRLVLAAVLSGAVFAASAQTPAVQAKAPVAAANAAAVPAETPVADEDGNVATKKTKSVALSCVQQTGSRIRAKNQAGKCNGAAGNSYTRDELMGTGRADMGDALRALDTSIR